LIRLSPHPSQILLTNADKYFWWLEFHRCIVRAHISENGQATEPDLNAIAAYDYAENAIRCTLGLPLRKSTITGKFDINSNARRVWQNTSLFWVLSSHPVNLPIISETALRNSHPNLASYINNPIERNAD